MRLTSRSYVVDLSDAELRHIAEIEIAKLKARGVKPVRPTGMGLNEEVEAYMEFVRHFPITVTYRSNGAWAICRNGDVLTREYEWEYEVSPSNRTEDFLKRSRFASPEEASTILKQAFGLE